MGLILAAKGQGSAQGLSNVIEGAIKGPSMLAMQVMYAINYPDDAWNSTVDYAQKALEDFSYYGPENTLHIMQGHVYDVEYAQAASSTSMGIGMGLNIAPALSLYRLAGVPNALARTRGGVDGQVGSGLGLFADDMPVLDQGVVPDSNLAALEA